MKPKHILWVLSCITMMLLMGTVYAYSVLRYHIESLYQTRTLESGLPYMTALFFYACSMMVTGRYLKPKRLRKIVFYGTLLIISGYFLSGITTHIYALTLTYGVLIGTGVGMVYGVPIYMVQILFPKKSGQMTGLILLGFGMSPLITAPLSRILIETWSLRETFFVLGFIFLMIQLPLSYLFIVKEKKTFNAQKEEDSTKIKLKPFKRIYALFVIATTIGLMMIGLTYTIGVDFYDLNPNQVTLMISLFAILNGIARPLFGWVMDQTSTRVSGLISVGLMILGSLVGILNQGTSAILFGITFGLFWFNLGAWLAIIPATVKAYYGVKQYAKTYGKLFTAYGLGAILGTLISGFILDFFDHTVYLYSSLLVLMGVSIVLLIKLPNKSLN